MTQTEKDVLVLEAQKEALLTEIEEKCMILDADKKVAEDFLIVKEIFLKQRKYVMSGPMDELWHSFILFTKKYHDFCIVSQDIIYIMHTRMLRTIHHIPHVQADGGIKLSRKARISYVTHTK